MKYIEVEEPKEMLKSDYRTFVKQVKFMELKSDETKTEKWRKY